MVKCWAAAASSRQDDCWESRRSLQLRFHGWSASKNGNLSSFSFYQSLTITFNQSITTTLYSRQQVCCPPDESTVLFPDSIDVNSFESSARNDTVAMPRIAVVEDENSADSLHTWPGDSTENIIWPRLPRNCGKVPIDVMRARIAGGVVAPKG